MRTTFAEEISEKSASDTVLTQETPESGADSESERNVKFPKRIKRRGRTLATIYAPSESYPNYRVAWSAGGRRLMKGFHRYGEAKLHAEKMAKDLAKGSQAPALTSGQASDALAGFERLQGLYEKTGRRFTIRGAVSEFAEIVEKLNGRPPMEAVDGFLATVATVQREDIAKAVDEFLLANEPRTKASDGKRPELSPKYFYNLGIMLRRFAGVFPNTAVCDLTKAHVDRFFASLASVASKSRNGKRAVSAKVRNHHRAAIQQFLNWAVRKDYLPTGHRLTEADAMRRQNGNESEIQFYTPAEFAALLETAQGPMRAMIAIGGLAGLRTQELLRLAWEDTRRVEGHIEVTSGKAKTRQRRLVEIVSALAQWLAPFAEFTGPIWTQHEITFQQHFGRVCDKAEYKVKGKKVTVKRKANGLRHAFCTYHLAAHGNENATAMQAGNSPAMLHQHYKGLATKKEAEGWFDVSPERASNVIPLANGQGAVKQSP